MVTVTPTEMCGNISSILVLCAYSMSDILELRVTAISATLLGLCFQYFRIQPLWIPIRWNLVLLCINTYMVTTLYLERQRANSMPQDMEHIYINGKFQQRGFNKVEFMRLYELAKIVQYPINHVIIQQGNVKNTLHFILDGTVSVSTTSTTTTSSTLTSTSASDDSDQSSSNNNPVIILDKYHFIGEISLLSRMLSSQEEVEEGKDNNNKSDGSTATTSSTSTSDSDDDDDNGLVVASANVTVVSSAGSASVGDEDGAEAETMATFLEWDFDTLVPYLKQDREVFNALSAYFNYDLTNKLLRESNISSTTTTTPTTKNDDSVRNNNNNKKKKSSSGSSTVNARVDGALRGDDVGVGGSNGNVGVGNSGSSVNDNRLSRGSSRHDLQQQQQHLNRIKTVPMSLVVRETSAVARAPPQAAAAAAPSPPYPLPSPVLPPPNVAKDLSRKQQNER